MKNAIALPFTRQLSFINNMGLGDKPTSCDGVPKYVREEAPNDSNGA